MQQDNLRVLFQPELGQCFAEEMRKYPWSAELEPYYSRLVAYKNVITEASTEPSGFSTAMWNTCYKNMAGAALWHYTTIEGLTGILKSREVWLHALSKRMSEGELTAFATQFDYRGLLAIEEDGQRTANKFAKDLFYLSLTDQEDPGDLWNFGDVRLRLKITPVLARAQLWRMNYSSSSSPLNVLKRFCKERFNKEFLPLQVSRYGAFFLDSYFSGEAEVRLLVKRFEETTDLVIRQSRGHEVVAIPLGTPNTRVSIDLVCVEVHPGTELSEVQRLLDTHGLELNVPCSIGPR